LRGAPPRPEGPVACAGKLTVHASCSISPTPPRERLHLTQADLIRNYVLMGLEGKEQAEVYRKYWHPMEQGFGHAEYAVQFDRFMRDYLTIKTGRIPNINEVYASFKSYVQGQKQTSMGEIVADVYRYSKYLVRLAFLKDGDKEINSALADINTLKVDVA